MFINKELVIIGLLIGVFVYLSRTTPEMYESGKKKKKVKQTNWMWYVYVVGGIFSVLFLISMGAKYHQNILWVLTKLPLVSGYFMMPQSGGGMGIDVYNNTSLQGKLNMDMGDNSVNNYTEAQWQDDDDISVISM